MKKIISKAGYYELSVPDDWTYDQEHNIISIYSNNSGGNVLQISSFAVAADYQMDLRQELAEFVAEKMAMRIEDVEKDIILDGPFAFIHAITAEAFIEYRMMFEKLVLLLITCQENFEDHMNHRHQCNNIIKSIRVSGVH